MAASILIADDDAVQRRLVENMVQKCGYLTVVVDSGDAAIAMLTAPDTPAIEPLSASGSDGVSEDGEGARRFARPPASAVPSPACDCSPSPSTVPLPCVLA